MIIDVLLDHKDACECWLTYSDLKDIYEYALFFDMQYLSRALDEGNESDIKDALKTYLIRNMYDVKGGELCEYIDALQLDLIEQTIDEKIENASEYSFALVDVVGGKLYKLTAKTQRGFESVYFSSKKDALQYIRKHVPNKDAKRNIIESVKDLKTYAVLYKYAM